MKKTTAVMSLVLFVSIVWAQQSPRPAKKAATPESLHAEIEALKPAKHIWREVKWKTCLLEALRDARAQKKPVLLWVLGGEPTKGRC